jgi:hypothetical protein
METLLAGSLRCMTRATASAADSVDPAPGCRGSAFGPLLAACQSPADARPSFASTQLLAGMARTAFELGERGDCTCIALLLLLQSDRFMTNNANSAGAMSEVRTRNREALYQLSKQLQKAAKKVADGSPADVDSVTVHPAQLKQSATEQPAEAAAAAAAPAAAGGAAGPSSAGAKRAAKKALSRMARSCTAADSAAEVDELAHTILSAAVQPEAAAEADVPATPTSAKKVKRRKQQAGSQNVLTLPGVNGGAELAKAGARASAKSHRTRSATGVTAAAPPGDDATPGRCLMHGFIMGMCRAQHGYSNHVNL